MKSLVAFLLVLVGVIGLWIFTKPSATPTPAPAAVAKDEIKPYPFATSIVSGKKLGTKDDTVTFTQGGFEVKLCSAVEEDTFKKNSAVYLAQLQQAYNNAKPYPLSTCVVMGDKLDDTAYAFVYEGRQFKFCCKACLEDFDKDPDKFVKIWDEAAAKTAPIAKK